MKTSKEKLRALRDELRHKDLDAYIIPHSDPHLGEDIPEYWRIIPWLTGFTGSASTVVITDSFAGLWTDSRYFRQAGEQLIGTGFTLMKPLPFSSQGYTDWLSENLPYGARIGFDGRIFSISSLRKLRRGLSGKGISFIADTDAIGEIWSDRPPLPASVAWDHNVAYAGKGRSEKITAVRAEMKKKGLNFQLLTSPSDIMWLLNVRGNDLPYSPVLQAFALVGEIQVLLFADEKKIPADIASEFDRLGIVILPYDEVEGMLTSLDSGSSVLICQSCTSVSLFNSIPAGIKVVEDFSIPSRLKAVKNKTEIDNITMSMIKEGVALTKFFKWIDDNSGSVPMTELSLAIRLQELRAQHKDYLGPSFQTIIAYNEHAALPHYSATAQSDLTLGEEGILLIDSGGQYRGGTTDITRSICLGHPSPRQRKDFTLVLKGHIALANAKFPHGTRGYQLDALARLSLWNDGLNYGHGTGHGVGYCLNVHEGPQSISPADNKTALEAGMIVSDEPGIYREGEYGIRTENLLLCYEDEETDFGTFLRFDTVSLCYLDKSLIDKTLLDKTEIDWIDHYHSEVYDKLSPFLSDAEKNWLKSKTGPVK